MTSIDVVGYMHRDADTDLLPPVVVVVEHFTNETEGHVFGEIATAMPADDYPTFRDLQREYGRCVSKVYHDAPEGPPVAVGYFFESVQKGERYKRGVWVEFAWLPALDDLPQTTRELRKFFPQASWHLPTR